MHGKTAVLTVTLTLVLAIASLAHGKEFSGARALEYTRKAAGFGPRPPGTPAIHKLRAYVVQQLKLRGCEIIPDSFNATTPNGPVAMENIIAKFPRTFQGTSGKAVVFSGHYDTKLLPDFVGANDGGSSTGFLLEMAEALHGAAHKDDVYIVFLDGEEAFKQWTDTDSLYGSRHLAEKWTANGMASRIKALINVDMIGDKDLEMIFDSESAASIRKIVWDTADRLGYSRNFPRAPSAITDDHIPFLRAGIRAVDLIDFNYGPNNVYWHTPQDTMDKLSANSFQIVGTVLMNVLRELEAAP
ncbi:MAG: M28 family peptidase [Acidobacteriota bacterium]|nr:M28 family peptidase [Acidobacteriota bacterium]